MNALFRNIQVIMVFLLGCSSLSAAPAVGDLATDFTLKNRATNTDVSLFDYKEKVIVLDFFAYWCGPCQVSSPDIQSNVQEYYDDLGGNANGIPVQVIAVNVDTDNPSATDSFIANAGLDLVLQDGLSAAYAIYSSGYVPLFVVINGVSTSSSHTQWEILYIDSGYSGAPHLKGIIDSVDGGSVPSGANDEIVYAVNAGSNQYHVQGTTSCQLSGTATPSSHIVSYTWTKVSGDGGVIENPHGLSTRVTGMSNGNYIFKLTITDNTGASHEDTVAVSTSVAERVAIAPYDGGSSSGGGCLLR